MIEKDYKKWKRKNVTLRGVSEGVGNANGGSARFGSGLYTAALGNREMAKGYGTVYFVVNARPKNPMKFKDANHAEIWIQNRIIFKNYNDVREFNKHTTIEAEMLKLGYDGLEVIGREIVNYTPENVLYFSNERQLMMYYEDNIEKQMVREFIKKILQENVDFNSEVISTQGSISSYVRYKTKDNKAYADIVKEKDGWHIAMIESDVKGGGTAIIKKIIEDAKKAGVKKITLTTTEFSGWGFFDKLGFVEVGDNNKPHDVPMMMNLQENEEKTNLNDNFWKWFSGSKVVDKNGNPLVVYHGTGAKFDEFDSERTPGGVVWFTSNKQEIEAGEVGAAGHEIGRAHV